MGRKEGVQAPHASNDVKTDLPTDANANSPRGAFEPKHDFP